MVQWSFELNPNWRVNEVWVGTKQYNIWSFTDFPVLVCCAKNETYVRSLLWKNSYYGQLSCRASNSGFDQRCSFYRASVSRYAKRMFQRIYAKLLTVKFAKCVFDPASLFCCANAVCSRTANVQPRSTWEGWAQSPAKFDTHDIYWACCSFY